METENQADLNAPDSQDKLKKKVGNIEVEKLAAKPVVVKEVEIKIQTKKATGEKVGELVHLHCKHPDSEDLINISKCLYLKDKKVKESGLWYSEDKEENIQKGSALAGVLTKYEVETPASLKDKTLPTEATDSGYLAIKSY